MNKLTSQTLDTLLNYSDSPVLSIYIPTHRYPTGPNISEDQTRFKNLVKAGIDQWREVTDEKTVKHLAERLDITLNDVSFWDNTTESLAIFATKDSVQMINLPIECEEHIFVGETFDVTPLLITQEINQPYYVLALALQSPKLFRGDMYDIQPVDIELPASYKQALNIDETRPEGHANRTIDGAHGQGDPKRTEQEDRLRYLRIIDDKIVDSSDVDSSLPFIIASTENEAADFKSLTKLTNVIDTVLPGNHTATPTQELHTLSWQIFQAVSGDRERQSILDHFDQKTSAQKTSVDDKTIYDAAIDGRIETLLIDMCETTTDSVNDSAGQKLLIRFPSGYGKFLQDLVRTVVSQSGKIVCLDKTFIPQQATTAAIFRY